MAAISGHQILAIQSEIRSFEEYGFFEEAEALKRKLNRAIHGEKEDFHDYAEDARISAHLPEGI